MEPKVNYVPGSWYYAEDGLRKRLPHSEYYDHVYSENHFNNYLEALFRGQRLQAHKNMAYNPATEIVVG